MSNVRKSKRKESPIQYLETARELRKYALFHCPKFPKRYKEYVSLPIAELTREIYKNVISINSTFATEPFEIQLRIEYEIEAINNLYDLQAEIDMLHELSIEEANEYESSHSGKKPIKYLLNDNIWVGFIDLIYKEINLLKAVKRRDKKKYYEKVQKADVNELVVIS